MQGTTIKLLTGGLLMVAAAGYVQAEALQPDPAWQQGTLANGLSWQVLATPQRPSDRIEVRLSVNIGSLSESTQQSGFSRFIPRLALTQSGSLPTMQARSLWQQSIDPKRPLPPAIVSYDYTMFNLSLPNNRNDLLKEALSWLADASGKLAITPESINHALQGSDMVATWPLDTKEGWWRYRLKGSTMLGHDPAAPLKQPIDVAQLKDFYQKWYTPDAMTLIVVGNVDSRSVAEQINKTFGDLKGKRETPAAVPTLSPLPTVPVSIMTNAVRQDKLSIMWDAPWQPIRDSAALQRYWRDDLAREVNHRTYGPSNWERINRFLFGSDSSFPNAAYNYPLYCALQVCLFPLLPYHDKSLWNNSYEKKKEDVKGHSKILFQTCSHFESREWYDPAVTPE